MQRAYFAAADAARLLDIVLYFAQRATSTFNERFACGSQSHRSRRSAEERAPEHPLEFANLAVRAELDSREAHAPHVRSEALRPPLNEGWITRYFALEQEYRDTLADPESTIVRKSGHIFMVYVEGETAGCVALIPMGEGVSELSKNGGLAPPSRLRYWS